MTTSISNISNHQNLNPVGINDIVDSFGHLGGMTSQQARDIITFHQPAQHSFCLSLLDSWVRGRHLAEVIEWLDGKSHLVEWMALEGLERGAENSVLINGRAAATKERAGKNYLKKVEKKLRAQLRGKNIVFAARITTINDYISKEQMEELRHLPAEQQERAVKMTAQSFANISHTSLADFLSGGTIGKRTKGELIKLTQAAGVKERLNSHGWTRKFDEDETKSLIIIEDNFTIEGHIFINSKNATKMAMELGTNKRFVLLPIVADNTDEVCGEEKWNNATTCEMLELTPQNGWQEIGGVWKVEVLSPASA